MDPLDHNHHHHHYIRIETYHYLFSNFIQKKNLTCTYHYVVSNNVANSKKQKTHNKNNDHVIAKES
ncbi:hypothetical protein DERP_008114 [Dermatophagoides pteronyssinus]|uniref:Uncharacterized protein n=1 Tax=Dermatophagoides pteronyssinus TaxID=6956 RepID=A0ABQ8JJS6_DERPT|nr:hypothetical protein DERP_008114 [Dermatophagoides pteronyssinus]